MPTFLAFGVNPRAPCPRACCPQVLSSALEAVRDMVRYYPRVFEAQLDRLLPTLFCKGVEAKEHVRQSCADLLSGAAALSAVTARKPCMHA